MIEVINGQVVRILSTKISQLASRVIKWVTNQVEIESVNCIATPGPWKNENERPMIQIQRHTFGCYFDFFPTLEHCQAVNIFHRSGLDIVSFQTAGGWQHFTDFAAPVDRSVKHRLCIRSIVATLNLWNKFTQDSTVMRRTLLSLRYDRSII